MQCTLIRGVCCYTGGSCGDGEPPVDGERWNVCSDISENRGHYWKSRITECLDGLSSVFY